MKADRVNHAQRHCLTWNFIVVRRRGDLTNLCSNTIPFRSEGIPLFERMSVISSSFSFLKWLAAVKANEVEGDVLIYWSVCASERVRHWGTVMCASSHSNLNIPLWLYHHFPNYILNWQVTNTLSSLCTLAFVLSLLSAVSLNWRRFPCRSKSNIWVSLYLVEQDLQDIVGRMCELEQFTPWESPIHTHTRTLTLQHTHTHSLFADIVSLWAIQLDFQVQRFMPDMLMNAAWQISEYVKPNTPQLTVG